MSIAHITFTIEQRVTCIVNCTTSNVFLAPVLGALVLEAPVLVQVVLVAPVQLALVLVTLVLEELVLVAPVLVALMLVAWHQWWYYQCSDATRNQFF